LRKVFGKEMSTIFLSFLMVITPFNTAYVFGNFIQQPKVFVQSFMETVEVEGKKFELQCLGKVTQYSNGTKLVEGSVTIENISKQIPRLRINLTKLVTQEELQAITEVEQNHVKSSRQVPAFSESYPGNLQKYRWDNNAIWFVRAPGNYTIFVKYDHDDNYETYYPGMWNLPWDIAPGEYGNEKLHTHMAVSDVYDWKTGARSEEEIMRKYVMGTKLGVSIIGAGLVALITWQLGSSTLGIILSLVVSALVALFNWLLEVLGISNKSQWIEDVVQAEQGDGFFWSWGFRTKSVDAWIYDPLLPYIGSGLDPRVLQGYSQFLSQYHRIAVGFYEVREFYRTWGSQRDASPETWNVELWYDVSVPAGIFADYGSLSK